MKLVALPAFTDNYIWMLHDGAQALVVDPGDSAPVLAALDASKLRLSGILVTHHHADHIGGLAALRPRLQGPVWGPATETIPQPCRPMRGGEQFDWAGLPFSVIDVPGHTAGHIAYFNAGTGKQAPLLFCGDTLFSGGCGRLFEGTAAQMANSLAALAALPSATRVCCAHEYTVANLRFASAVEPDNRDLQRYRADCERLREQGLPTLPSTIGLERRINPFLRCAEPAVIASAHRRNAEADDPVAVLATLRTWKNMF